MLNIPRNRHFCKHAFDIIVERISVNELRARRICFSLELTVIRFVTFTVRREDAREVNEVFRKARLRAR